MIVHAQSVVPDHKHAQNIGFLAGFLWNAAASRESPFLFSCLFVA